MKTELPFNSPLANDPNYVHSLRVAERYHKRGWAQMALFIVEQLADEATNPEEIAELKRIAKVVGG